ncbi:15836_t:CDS:2, partial [Entrophospora sp. SA101]
MFKKFNIKEDIASQSQLKSSVQRNVRAKLLEQYKNLEPVLEEILPKKSPLLQVDKGAIKFILSGANIMCPGLTSKGARIDEELPAEAIVSIFAEGKEHALAVGLTKKSTED